MRKILSSIVILSMLLITNLNAKAHYYRGYSNNHSHSYVNRSYGLGFKTISFAYPNFGYSYYGSYRRPYQTRSPYTGNRYGYRRYRRPYRTYTATRRTCY